MYQLFVLAFMLLGMMACSEKSEFDFPDTEKDAYFATRFQDDNRCPLYTSKIRECRKIRNECWRQETKDRPVYSDEELDAILKPCFEEYLLCIGITNSECDKVVQIDAGHGFTCAVLASGNLRCWGENDEGQLGYGHKKNIGDDEKPYQAGNIDVGGKVKQVATGEKHICVLLEGGYVRCWGENQHGQLGYGHTKWIGDDEKPSSADYLDLGGKVIQITAGWYHNCALLESGDVKCWGWNNRGQLGYDHTNNVGDDETLSTLKPVLVNGKVAQLSAGIYHTCAVLDSGKMDCWGSSDTGQLTSRVPNSIVKISSDLNHNCVILMTGEVQCWGWNKFAQLGYVHPSNTFQYSNTGRLIKLDEKVLDITAAHHHTCVITESGNVKCWGLNDEGQLGYGHKKSMVLGDKADVFGNVAISGEAVQITSGVFHTCVLLSSGQVQCWGKNDWGQLGYGYTNTIGDDETPASAGYVEVLKK